MKARPWLQPPELHLLAREEGAATIGNVYTRHDRRGRGLGTPGDERRAGELPGSRRLASTFAPTTMQHCVCTSRSALRVTANSTRRWRCPESITADC